MASKPDNGDLATQRWQWKVRNPGKLGEIGAELRERYGYPSDSRLSRIFNGKARDGSPGKVAEKALARAGAPGFGGKR